MSRVLLEPNAFETEKDKSAFEKARYQKALDEVVKAQEEWYEVDPHVETPAPHVGMEHINEWNKNVLHSRTKFDLSENDLAFHFAKRVYEIDNPNRAYPGLSFRRLYAY